MSDTVDYVTRLFRVETLVVIAPVGCWARHVMIQRPFFRLAIASLMARLTDS